MRGNANEEEDSLQTKQTQYAQWTRYICVRPICAHTSTHDSRATRWCTVHTLQGAQVATGD